MSDPRNHHYVPQAYLRGFGDPADQILVRWRMNDKPLFVSNVRNVASERDFYSFVNDRTGKVDHRSFEAGLSRSEAMLRESLQQYVHGGSTVPMETLRPRIAVGVGFQMTRTKYFRRKLERIGDHAARTWMVHHRPDLADAADHVLFVPGSDIHLKWIGDWALNLATVLMERSWFIVRATGGMFITSDNPVYGIAGYTDALDVGVLAATEIRYPVDATTALVWTPQPGNHAAILFREREVIDFNTATFANAYEQTYAHPDYKNAVERLPRHKETLITRINAMVAAPESKKSGTRRFDPSAASEK